MSNSIAQASRARLTDYIDLERYPLDDLDTSAGKALVDQCQRMMRDHTLCLLPGFLRAQAVQTLAAEINGYADQSHQVDYLATPYGWRDNSGFPEGHPRASLHRRRCGVLTTDQCVAQGPCMTLFAFDELTEFVRRLLGFETLFRSACPTLSVQVNVMRSGDRFGWHFDTNDGVVSLLIQQADAGGEFEYAPLIRAEDDENYAGVSRLFAGLDEPRAPPMPPGTFTLFMGRRSAHRVAPVLRSAQPRLSVLYSYDRSPNMVFPPASCERFLHPHAEPFLGTGVSSTVSR